MLRKIRAMMLFAREIGWVNEPSWTNEDAKVLELFLSSDTGKKLGMTLLNMVIKTQSSCIESKKDLEYNAGFANGFKGAVSSIESLADNKLYGGSEEDELSNLEL
jgi:hypothetical protein|tara:strand:- start:4248 stop:4562 length:315 start_codon:yes stop_codon:yes gene_type:complete